MQRTQRFVYKYPRLACAPPDFKLCLPTLSISQPFVSNMHGCSFT